MDIIWGTPIKVVDGDTFDMKVTHVSRENEYEYSPIERIRIAEINAPELPSRSGWHAAQHLWRVIKGNHLRCEIQTRDIFKRLICKVKIIGKK